MSAADDRDLAELLHTIRTPVQTLELQAALLDHMAAGDAPVDAAALRQRAEVIRRQVERLAQTLDRLDDRLRAGGRDRPVGE